jgi:import inner membrane translocase subunit TIM44
MPDSKILDLRNVDLHTARLLPDTSIPVLVISFSTQEVIVFRDRITKEIVFGKEDKIDACRYVAVLTKEIAMKDGGMTGAWEKLDIESSTVNRITGGWRMIDMVKHSSG